MAIRKRADQRIGHRVDHERDGERRARKAARDPERLVVVEEQEVAEGPVQDPLGVGTESEGNARQPADSGFRGQVSIPRGSISSR